MCEMGMVDIKLFAKIGTENPKQEVRIYSDDIGMEFDIVKCTMLIMKCRKRQMTEGIDLPNQGKIRTLGEMETYEYLGILEADINKKVSIKEKNYKRIHQENEKSTRNQTT